MSKNLFNQNTFGSKNVNNSDSIGSIKSKNATITNATIINLTNTELQAATTNVAVNAAAISGFNSRITTNEGNITTNAGNITTNAGNITTNAGNIATNTGNIATNTGNIATNTGNIATNTSAIATKQATLTDAANAGANISINGSQQISATNTEYTADQGVALSGTVFSLDLSTITGNSPQALGQNLTITKNGAPQLKVQTVGGGQDAEVRIMGRRSANVTSILSRVIFSNLDDDLSVENKFAMIGGRVQDKDTNYGGFVLCNFPDGQTETQQVTMSSSGNFNIGTGAIFQDDYKLKVNGSVSMRGLNYVKPQLRFFAYDKDDVTFNTWGNGSRQTNIVNDRRVGESFCSTSSGVITLSKNGYYRIRLSAQTQSDAYNNRLGFMNYLRIVTSGGTTTNYDQTRNYNFFGWIYVRNTGNGAHGSVTFEDYIYLESGDAITSHHKLETDSDTNFNNTLVATDIDNYLNITIERIYDEDPEE